MTRMNSRCQNRLLQWSRPVYVVFSEPHQYVPIPASMRFLSIPTPADWPETRSQLTPFSQFDLIHRDEIVVPIDSLPNAISDNLHPTRLDLGDTLLESPTR